jgi:serine/threonine protein kinase
MSNTPEHVKSIFHAALDIADAAERAAFIERSCGDDAALRQRVEDLLHAYGQSGGPLDKLAAALAPTKLTEPAREQAGTMIGRYKLIERIGEGAMGSVWMAQQTEPVKRLVAIKVIKAGVDSKTVLTRFEAERQALALMDHPNIAKVFDGGVSDSGSPYFAMELVKGVPITRYCDERKLTPRERLSLFVPVCQAVQHAHQKGIIHRDIKPTNVLVTQYDGRPVPKVIDFGVAKAVGQPLTEKTLVTGFGAIVGTPAYMSPEQAELNQLDIDTRSDIYALGVLLYEILTGSTPFGKDELEQAGLLEILRVIREQDPPRPSTKLSTANALPTIAANRGTEPKALTVILRSELDWIVMKALEKDRNRRYETANSFAADIERYLSGEAVQAHPPTAAYRLRKFARKHRAPVIGLAAVAAALVVGIAGTTWGLLRARQAEQAAKTAEHAAVASEQRAVEERDAKDVERKRAEQQLANGLLRPIGFSAEGIDAAELRSFVDWSAIPESPLKMRVLEIALDNPETAFRVARRAERVIQSCVGLSPTRRAQAIKLVSAKQRDPAADPRSRVAACWLALELGSADLRAWAESCNYLIEPKNESSDQFQQFINFAVSRSDSQQIAVLDFDPLISMAETTPNDDVRLSLCVVLPKLAPRLELAQCSRTGDALIAMLEKSTNADVLNFVNNGLTELAPRLEPAQAMRAWDALSLILAKSTDEFVLATASDAVAALSARLEPAQARRAADLLFKILERPESATCASDAAFKAFGALAPQMEAAQAKRAWDALIANPEKLRDTGLAAKWWEEVFRALAPRLQPAQVKTAWDALANPKKWGALSPGVELKALVPRLEPAQVTRAADGFLAMLEKSTDPHLLCAATRGLTILAPRLEPAQVIRTGNGVIAMLETSRNQQVLDAGMDGLSALAPKFDSVQASHAANALLAMAQKQKDSWPNSTVVTALVALAPKLKSAQAKRAWDAIVAVEKTEDSGGFAGGLDFNFQKKLVAVSRSLEPAQSKRAGETAIATLQKATDQIDQFVATEQLVALVPYLEQKQVALACRTLLGILEKSTGSDMRYDACRGLAALAPRLQPTLQDDLSTAATACFLDYCSSFDAPANTAWELAPSSQRALSKLLSHPGCVGEVRQDLLRRFEEIVLYDGKPIFTQPDATDEKKPAGHQQLPRRFHNLHDAATWIQQNWPDFDLEATYPATWRGSR